MINYLEIIVNSSYKFNKMKDKILEMLGFCNIHKTIYLFLLLSCPAYCIYICKYSIVV